MQSPTIEELTPGMCRYCAQVDNEKDSFGFCKDDKCFERSGLAQKIPIYAKKAMNLLDIPMDKTCQIGRVVSNATMLEHVKLID